MSEATTIDEAKTVDVLDPEQPIAAYNPIRTAIVELQARYGKLVFDVSTTKGLEDAKQARMAIREPRYKVEHIRKALKAPALAYSKRIDDEAKEYTAALLLIETPIDEQIKTEENRKENERIERERAEAAERLRISVAIADIRETAVCAVGKGAEDVLVFINELNAYAIDEATFGERVPEAVLAKNATIQQLQDMYAAAVAKAAEDARLQSEREEAERVRQQQAAEAERLRQQQDELERQRREFEEQQVAARRAAVPVAEPALATAPTLYEGYTEETSRAIWQDFDKPAETVGADDDSVPFPTAQAAGTTPAFYDVGASIDTPSRTNMIAVISDHYGVDDPIAEQWLRDAFKEA